MDVRAPTTASRLARRIDMQFLAPPPRRLPPSLVVQTLFGGMLQQMGWLFFGFGMVFAWVFVGNAEIAWSLRAGPLDETQALVSESFDTHASEDDARVYGTRYAFGVGDWDYEGTSYATGHHLGEGDTAIVEYSRSDPRMSRIKGMRSAMFGPAVLIVLIFPAAGLALVLAALPGRLRELQLLRHGLPAFGRLIDKTPTNMSINERTVYRLRFQYQARDGRSGVAEARSHVPESLEDETEEALLYDPRDLGRAVVLDGAASRPQLGADGHLRGRPRAALARLLLPALVLGGHGYWAYLRFLG